MKTKIQLNNAEEVYEFVSIARKCEFDIDVQYRHFFLDGKSLVGLMSIDFTNPLIIYSYGTNPVYEQMLRKFAISDMNSI